MSNKIGATRTPRPPKAKRALPLVGHGLKLMKDPLPFLRSLPQYGRLVRIKLGPETTYVINDSVLAREVMTGQAGRFEQGRMIERVKPLLGDGVGTLSGPAHLAERRLLAPAFAQRRLGFYAETMTRLAADQVARWRPGQLVDLDTELNDLALRTVAATLYSSDLGADAVTVIQRRLPEVLAPLPRRVVVPAWVNALPTGANRRWTAANNELRAVTVGVVKAYRDELEANPETDHGDLLSMLLRARDDETGASLSDSGVHDELVNFLVAGSETTGATLSWVLHHLSVDADLDAALAAEVTRVLGSRPATYADLGALDLTKRIITEALRLYAPWNVLRYSPDSVVLADWTLPRGSSLMLSPYVLHRDPELYPDPLRFDPERWVATSPDAAGRSGAYVPFGLGQRQCPGNVFALVEMTLHLATIVGSWRFTPMPDAAPVREVARGAVVHPSALRLVAQSR